jgi:hypothetical protein
VKTSIIKLTAQEERLLAYRTGFLRGYNLGCDSGKIIPGDSYISFDDILDQETKKYINGEIGILL